MFVLFLSRTCLDFAQKKSMRIGKAALGGVSCKDERDGGERDRMRLGCSSTSG